MTENKKSTIEKYKEELEVDTQIDELNLKEMQLKLPAIKHKWAARYIIAKQDLRKLQDIQEVAEEKIGIKINQNAPVKLSDRAIKTKVITNETYKKIRREIINQKLLIEYLEKAEQVFKSMTFDIKNAIDLMKLEQQ